MEGSVLSKSLESPCVSCIMFGWFLAVLKLSLKPTGNSRQSSCQGYRADRR